MVNLPFIAAATTVPKPTSIIKCLLYLPQEYNVLCCR